MHQEIENMKLPTRFNPAHPVSVLAALMALAIASYAAELTELPAPKQLPKPINAPNPGTYPSDAISLFDGLDLLRWKGEGGGEAKWTIKDEVATINGTGSIVTKDEFGDCQLHLEWASPSEVKGEGQGRGNSGVYLQSRYEIQILDSWANPTYFHGMAGSLYKQYAPLVNASRKPGVWQTYDIIFHAPRFDPDGRLAKAGNVTLLHNGVLVLDNVEIKGTTSHEGLPQYTAHPLKQPLMLQDHGNPVRFRNIWIRPL